MKHLCFIAYKLKRILGKKQIKLATANILERDSKSRKKLRPGFNKYIALSLFIGDNMQ